MSQFTNRACYLLCVGGRAPAAAAGCLQPQHVAGGQRAADFAGQNDFLPLVDEAVAAGRAGCATAQAIGWPFSPLADDADGDRGEELDSPDQAITAAATAVTPDPSRRAYVCTRSGKAYSNASMGVLRVLLMWT